MIWGTELSAMQAGAASVESVGDGLPQNLIAFPIEVLEIAGAVQHVMAVPALMGADIEEARALPDGSSPDHLTYLVAVLGYSFLGEEVRIPLQRYFW